MLALASLCRQCSTHSCNLSARSLYRELYKQIKQLPKQTQTYYRNYARQNFTNWNDETDPGTLEQLHTRARQDAAWVVKKYSK